MSAHSTQNCNWFLLHFQEGLQFQQCLAVFAHSQQIRHLKYHSIQHRLRDGIDIAFDNGIGPGIGCNFRDLPLKSRHGSAGDVNEVGTEIGADFLAVAGKMPCHPGDQIPLALLGELHNGAIFTDGIPKFFEPLIRLPFHHFVSEYHGAVVGHIGENLDHLLPVALVHLEKIDLVHLDEGPLRHHG